MIILTIISSWPIIYGMTAFVSHRKNCISIALFVVFVFTLSANQDPLASNGYIDLSFRSFSEYGAINLDGQWILAPGKLYEPNTRISPDTSGVFLVEQPQIWNRIQVNNTVLSGTGYATQQLRITLPEDYVGRILSLRITHIYTAYRLYVNGKLVASNGKVAIEKTEGVAQYLPQIVFFTANQKDILLTLHISNYHHNKGGLNESISLGTDAQMMSLRERRIMAEMMTVGILFIIGIYHIMIFFLRKKEITALLFSLFCVLVSFRTLLMGERIWYVFFPNFPWVIGHKLDYLTICLFFPLFVWFIKLIYPRYLHKVVPIFVSIVSLIFVATIIFTPPSFFTKFLAPYNIIIIFSGVITISAVVRGTYNKQAGAFLQLIGGLIFFLTAINDILYNIGIINSTYLMPIGLVTFTIFQTVMLSYLFTRAYALIELMNNSLWRFVPKEFLTFLGKQDIVDIQLGDQTNGHLTVLFSDIRGFTKIVESMSSADSFTFINRYLDFAGPVIRENGGFIDKYIGDAILAIFPGNSDSAVKAGINLHKATEQFNTANPQYPDIHIGVGINSGETMIGIIGEEERLESTVISDVVNVASRLEALNKLHSTAITISDNVYKAIQSSDFHTRNLGSVYIRGREKQMNIYEVLDAYPEDVKTEKLKIANELETAIDYLETGETAKAKAILEQLVTAAPKDLVVKHLLLRIERNAGKLVRTV